MKFSALLLSLLLLLSLGGLTASHIGISKSAEDLSFQEYPITGDLSAADGLSVELHADLGHHLFWDIGAVPGRETHTKFHFSPKEHHESSQGSNYVELHASTNYSAGTSGAFDLQNGQWWLHVPLQELSDQVDPGTTGETTVLVSDYEDFYPLDIEVHTPEQTLFSDQDFDSSGSDSQFLFQLADAFRFPVLENHRQKLSLTKDEQGNVTEISSSPEGLSGVSIYSTSFASDEFIYFIVDARTDEDGRLLDDSGTPNGYGIYALPLDKKELQIEDLQFICPLDSTFQVQFAAYHPERNEVVCICQQPDCQMLTCISLTTGEITQQLPLDDYGDSISHLFLQDNLLLLFRSRNTANFLVQDEQGHYQEQFDLHFPEEEAYHQLQNVQLSCQFDGDRLAIATSIYGEGSFPLAFSNYYNASYGLYVFGPEGIRYAGRFLNPLDVGSDGSFSPQFNCRLTDGRDLRLHCVKGGS